MKYIIRNLTQNKWVGPAGSRSAYTRDQLKARRFDTREQAQADCCGDERVVELHFC